MRALAQFGKIGADVLWHDPPRLKRLSKVTRKRRPGSLIDENLGLCDRLIVALAHVALERADQVEMAARAEPIAMDDGPCRGCHGADHICRTAHRLKIVHRLRGEVL